MIKRANKLQIGIFWCVINNKSVKNKAGKGGKVEENNDEQGLDLEEARPSAVYR